MKRVVFCVTAHPDDEAFGPSGTIALLAKTEEVHVICVTDGASDPRFHKIGGKKLSLMRLRELRTSANVLGVTHTHLLHYQDGSLSNNLYHEIAAKITKLVKKYKPSLLITNELRGVSGHLDHVAVAMITSYVYRKNPEIDAIWYNCVSKSSSDLMKNYFVFFPEGFNRDDVDMVVNIQSVFMKKIQAARSHKTQMKDALRVIGKWMILPKEEWFFVSKRRDTISPS
jgi:LmbE family N-acetylglucosaminyl deacetylase